MKNLTSYFEAAIQIPIDKACIHVSIIPTRGRFWCEIDFPEDLERAKSTISSELL